MFNDLINRLLPRLDVILQLRVEYARAYGQWLYDPSCVSALALIRAAKVYNLNKYWFMPNVNVTDGVDIDEIERANKNV